MGLSMFADIMTPKLGLASLLLLAAVIQLSSGMALGGVEKCEPSIIPRSVSGLDI